MTTSTSTSTSMLNSIGPTLLVDGVQSMSVHNGVVRLELVQWRPDGKTQPVLQLQVPQTVVRKLIEALHNAS